MKAWEVSFAYADKIEKDGMEEMVASGSDRAIGIVGASMVEKRLTDALKRRLVSEDDKATKDAFRDGGMFGTFQSKIDLSFLIGTVSKAGRRELETIKTIRNRFAHRMSAISFECDDIRNLCMNLSIVEKSCLTISTGETGIPIDMPDLLDKLARGAIKLVPHPELQNPKDRYLLTVINFMSRLSMITPGDEKRPLTI